ncbi:ubiquitin 3 binding protein But2 C-terminal domain-containing protein [Xylariaceae sp. FL0016]|nr:ubiquitin 3 binding protein But2 C-terminal domain-containing protein [Xylariaceae sp. FL0016]
MLRRSVLLSSVAGSSQALTTRESTCSLTLTTSGTITASVGQYGSGQTRAGLSETPSSFTLDGDALTDASGRGCWWTPPTTVLQCDVGQTPESGFAVDCDGTVSFNGQTTFYECQTGVDDTVMIYLSPDMGSSCGEIELHASGCTPANCNEGSTGGNSPTTGSETGTTPGGTATGPGSYPTGSETGTIPEGTATGSGSLPTTGGETRTTPEGTVPGAGTTLTSVSITGTTSEGTAPGSAPETATYPAGGETGTTPEGTATGTGNSPTTGGETGTTPEETAPGSTGTGGSGSGGSACIPETTTVLMTQASSTTTVTQTDCAGVPTVTVTQAATAPSVSTVTVTQELTVTRQECASQTGYPGTATGTGVVPGASTNTGTATGGGSSPSTGTATGPEESTGTVPGGSSPSTAITTTGPQESTGTGTGGSYSSTSTATGPGESTGRVPGGHSSSPATVPGTATPSQPTPIGTATAPIYPTSANSSFPTGPTSTSSSPSTETAPGTYTSSPATVPGTASSVPGMSTATPTVGSTSGYPTAPSQTTSPSSTPSGSSCPADLTGNWEYPHLIVPIDSANIDEAYGTSYFGEVTSTISTVFNFDIPSSDSGKTCNLIFMFPEKDQLETSSFNFTGSGAVSFAKLDSAVSSSTTYGNCPGVAQQYDQVTLAPGNAYPLSSFKCPGGQSLSFEMSSAGGTTDLRYFQDYNPCPLGLYITTS